MNMILFIHVQVGLNHPEFIFNTNTFHNIDCQIIKCLSHISTFQMLVIIVHRTFWWISLLLFLIQVSKRKSSPCSLYVDCRRKRYCRQKIAFGKGPHQLWCCTCNSLNLGGEYVAMATTIKCVSKVLKFKVYSTNIISCIYWSNIYKDFNYRAKIFQINCPFYLLLFLK
jgi:hypothetical protein